MVKPKKLPTDVNQKASYIAKLATGEITETNPNRGKNVHAVELGRLGGLVGGKARAKKLTKKQRHDIAKKAAKKRWG